METAAVTARKSLYIRGLQAAYAGVLEVLDDAFHAAVYRFFPDKSKWERMDIEGSAYVTRNSSIPLYSLIVLNKKGDADLILHCEENIEKVQVQDQYIMLRCKNDDGKVTLGIWIHDAADRERIYSSILRAKEIRKNSPDMNSLLSKYVNRQKSVASSEVAENVGTTSSVPPPFPKAANSSASQLLASALSASISTPSLQGLASTPTTAVTSVSSSVASSPQRPPVADKASTLMSILKSSSKKDVVSGNSNGNASLDDIIKAVDPVASVAAANIASRTSPSPVGSGNSSQQQTASAKLLSLLASAKSPSVTSLSSPSPSTSDFPTDGEISAKAKQRASNTSSPVAKALVGEDKVSALKSILSIGSTKVPLSPAPASILEQRAASPVSLPPAQAAVDLTLLSRTSSASPVTVAQPARHSPQANSTSIAASLQLFSSDAVSMKRVQPKLISPSDLEVF